MKLIFLAVREGTFLFGGEGGVGRGFGGKGH